MDKEEDTSDSVMGNHSPVETILESKKEGWAPIDYFKACRNLGLETQKMQMVAETIAVALRKGNKGCFTCGNKNHLKTQQMNG